MRPKRLPLDNHAMIEQDMEHIEQGQFGAAPRPRASSEGAADFAFQWPWVALDSDLVEESLDLPSHGAKAGGRTNHYTVGRHHVSHGYVLGLQYPGLDPFRANALGHRLHHLARVAA